MGIWSDVGKIMSERAPIRQKAIEPGPYNFDILDEDGKPALISSDGIQIGGWIEQIDNESPSSYEVSQRFAHATLFAFVPNETDAMYRFENAVLGWHVTSPDFKYIKRTNPIQHPKKRNLWAYKISEAKGRGYRDRGINSESDDPMKSPRRFAKYDHNLVAVDFKPLPTGYAMPSKEEIIVTNPEDGSTYYHEGYRYLEYDTRTNIYDVTVQTGQFVYAEGPDNNPKDVAFQGELNYLEVKQTFTLRWRLVPEDFVLDTTNFALGYPRKLNAAAAKVNSKPFMGYPRGTLLMLESEIDRYASGSLRLDPAQTQDALGKQQVERSFKMCDVIMPIVHFDPPHFSKDERGHNLKPFRRDTTSAPSDVFNWQFWRPESVPPWSAQPPVAPVAPEPTMLYYLVKFKTAAGVMTDVRIYGEYDFNKIFQHWSIP